MDASALHFRTLGSTMCVSRAVATTFDAMMASICDSVHTHRTPRMHGRVCTHAHTIDEHSCYNASHRARYQGFRKAVGAPGWAAAMRSNARRRRTSAGSTEV